MHLTIPGSQSTSLHYINVFIPNRKPLRQVQHDLIVPQPESADIRLVGNIVGGQGGGEGEFYLAVVGEELAGEQRGRMASAAVVVGRESLIGNLDGGF